VAVFCFQGSVTKHRACGFWNYSVISLSARVKFMTPKVGYIVSLMITVCVTRSKLALRTGEANMLRIASLSRVDRPSWHPNFN